MNGAHTTDTRDKIGNSVKQSSWRRRAKEKSKADLQCAVSAWEEDFSTPSIRRANRHMLWEEYPHKMDFDR